MQGSVLGLLLFIILLKVFGRIMDLPMGTKNGLHVVGYNSAESGPIWIKSEPNVWGWPWLIFGAIRTVPTI